MRRYFYNIITGKSRVGFGSLLKPLLVLLSFLFFVVVKARYFFYKIGILRSVKLKKPVISVGNITWGGTGKTPLSEALLHRFLQKGKGIALLTRGYGKDEERVIFQNLPGVDILSGKRRLFNALQAQENIDLDLFLMDDGFQHLCIRRDADIVTINATDPVGNGFLIPAGILREPLNSLKRADIVIITKSDLVDKERLSMLKYLIQGAAGDIDIFEAIHKPVFFYTAFKEKKPLNKSLKPEGSLSATQSSISARKKPLNKSLKPEGSLGATQSSISACKKPLDYLKARRVLAISGLADNSSFNMTLKQLDGLVVSHLLYMDHHKYVRTDMKKIAEVVKKNNIDTIVTTEKDWIKLKSIVKDPFLKEVEILVLKIEVKVKDDEVFYRRLSALLSG